VIRLGEFFKKRKWVIAAAVVLALAGTAVLFWTTDANKSQRYDFPEAGVTVTMRLPRGLEIPEFHADSLEDIPEEQKEYFLEDPRQNYRALFQQLPMGSLVYAGEYQQVWTSGDGMEGGATLMIYQKYPIEEGQSAAEVDYYPTRVVLAYNLALNRYAQIDFDYEALTGREHAAIAKSLRLQDLPASNP